jgi:hypothetical protein
LGSSQVYDNNEYILRYRWRGRVYLREGTVVPEVALVREAVPHKPELALLDVLLDGVEALLLADLSGLSVEQARRGNLVESGAT